MYSGITGMFISEDFFLVLTIFANKKYVLINVGPTSTHPILKSWNRYCPIVEIYYRLIRSRWSCSCRPFQLQTWLTVNISTLQSRCNQNSPQKILYLHHAYVAPSISPRHKVF